MSKLIESALILAFARITNFALVLVSPILLVRILDPESFGQYREFLVYAMLTANLAEFSIKSNLLYFIPKDPGRTREYVAVTNWLTLAGSILACLVLWSLGDRIRASTSFDFLIPLVIYVVLYANLTYLETFFVANKQPKKVFLYSVVRTVVRLTVVLGTAYVTRSVTAILHALIVVETIRIIAVLILTGRLGILSFEFKADTAKRQLGFIVPLGIAGTLGYLNQYVGQLIVSTQLGILALAIYTIGSYKLPFVRIVRGAISDAIFPDMVRQANVTGKDRIRLWKRGTIAYTFLVLPIFVLLFWYADVLIPFVFTDEYTDAVPIFRIMVFMLPIQCIELSSPLRAANRTGALLTGNIVMLVSNLACIGLFFAYLPDAAIFGPAVGMIVGHVLQHIYMGWKIVSHFDISVGALLKWRSLGTILLCIAVSSMVLVVADQVPLHDLSRVLLASLAFACVYFPMLRRFKLEEVEIVFEAVAVRLRGRRRKRSA